MIKASWLISTFYTHYFTKRPLEAKNSFKKLDVLNLIYFLKCNARKKKSFYDPDGIIESFCETCTIENGSYRSFLLLEACKKYETEFCTNVTTYMFRRVKKYVRSLTSATAKEIHEQCFRYYFRGEYANEDNLVSELFKDYVLRETSVRSNPPVSYTHLLLSDLYTFQTWKRLR